MTLELLLKLLFLNDFIIITIIQRNEDQGENACGT